MKIRMGFVSNSSSSSFICEVSGEMYSGYDANLENFDLVSCQNGHIFGSQYIKGTKEYIENEDDEEYLKLSCCPICTLQHIAPETTLNYLLYKYGLKLKDIEKEIRNDFKTLIDLNESME